MLMPHGCRDVLDRPPLSVGRGAKCHPFPSHTSSGILCPPMPDETIYMRLAIEEAGYSRPEDVRPHPKVGVVVVKNGSILAKAHRGEMGNGEHAKFVVLERKLNHPVIAGATVYTTCPPVFRLSN